MRRKKANLPSRSELVQIPRERLGRALVRGRARHVEALFPSVALLDSFEEHPEVGRGGERRSGEVS